MNELTNTVESAKVSFSYDDNQRSDEIIALKQLFFASSEIYHTKLA